MAKSQRLSWMLLALAIAITALLYQSYRSLWLPFSGYGDADMRYLQQEPAENLSAGDLTHFHSGNMAFEQAAPNLSWGLSAAFDRGDGIFERAFTPSQPNNWRSDADGLGPLFNQASCEGCHQGDGRSRPPTSEHEALIGGFIRISVSGTGPYGEPLAPAGYGAQISDHSIEGVTPEADIRVRWIEEAGIFPDGEVYRLRRPDFLVQKLAYGPLPTDTQIEMRMAPPVFGLGLLEAIPESTLLRWADPDDRDGDGISGRPNYVWDLERGGKILGRFSWKANAFDLRQQSASAAFHDMGINNELFFYRHDEYTPTHKARQNCEPAQTACLATFDSLDYELRPDQLRDLTTYLQLLGVAYRRNMDNPEVQEGEQLFHLIGCANCHKSSVMTGNHEIARLENQLIRPYTDLLLHDMGPGLAGRPDFEANAQEWRTAPLWGIGLTQTVNGHTYFLHDGRARNLQEAILWHGGEAEEIKERYKALPKTQRNALLLFLNQL